MLYMNKTLPPYIDTSELKASNRIFKGKRKIHFVVSLNCIHRVDCGKHSDYL